MSLIAQILVFAVALEHLFIMYMECFAWESLGKKIFRGAMPADMFTKTKAMAQNQGTYNGFLAAGLIWSLCIPDEAWSQNVATFFLMCVIVAGLVGTITASKKIFYTQSLPALVALFVLYMI